MRKINYLVGFVGLMCFTSTVVSAQGFLRARNQEIVNDNGNVLLRGIGLGGWVLQEPYMLQLSGIARTQTEIRSKINELAGDSATRVFYEEWIKNGITRADLDSLSAWGFNSVRYPMHYNLFTLPVEDEPVPGENTWLEEGFVLTDSLLSWCAANRIYLMLDLHAAPGGQGNDIAISDASEVRLWESEENKNKTVALWRKLAERYAGEEWIGGYDVLNEPNYGFESKDDKNGCAEPLNAPLRELLIRITEAIREVDRNHLIVIEGNCWGNNYNGIFPLWDDNIVISFHKYWNYNYEGELHFILKHREQNNAPIWLSESGENSNAWFTDAIRMMEEKNIGWCWWTYKRMGLACPMQVQKPEGYDALKQYWAGTGERPSQEQAVKVLSQLAENYKLKNTVFHKDYLDALFRQVRTDETLPYTTHELKSGSSLTVFASDYDLGRSGWAYHDTDSANYRTSTSVSVPWNSGESYRNDGVDIAPCNDFPTNGYCVSYTEPGEWLQYTIDVEKEGKYLLSLRTSHAAEGGRLHLTVNGEPAGDVTVPDGSAGEWTLSAGRETALKKGQNTLRVFIDKGGFDLNYIRLATER
ncbi:MAG: cellulase family glycosylhydrolase [Dysgonamonadaceae bacterium]|jgi:aryl-phospho-beta-D-glucosidase BglC (GH1 family)|nr:cellulase family glycosylhydrolase [Dysgonamonadaceae bacterium]